MAITYYQANKILDRAFGSALWDANATLYIGLSTSAINPDGTGGKTGAAVGGGISKTGGGILTVSKCTTSLDTGL